MGSAEQGARGELSPLFCILPQAIQKTALPTSPPVLLQTNTFPHLDLSLPAFQPPSLSSCPPPICPLLLRSHGQSHGLHVLVVVVE